MTSTPTIVTKNESPVYRGKFRYLDRDAKLTVNPNLYHLPPLSAFYDIQTLPIKDIRPSLTLGNDSPYKLDHDGFTARHHPSRLHSAPYSKESWNDPKLIETVYAPEVEKLVKSVTGCKIALVESAVLRNNVHTEVDSLSKDPSGADFAPDDAGPCPRMIGFSEAGGASPAPKVHLDFSPRGSRIHIRKYHRNLALAAEPVIEAENRLLKSGVGWDDLKNHYHGGEGDAIPRFALFSVWRPLKRVRRDPIAVASCASFPASDLAPVDIVLPSGQLIPSHLSQIIDPDHSDTDSEQSDDSETQDRHLTGSYLSYGPVDEAGKRHDWHFISNHEPEEVLVIQLFDNQMEARSALIQSDADANQGSGHALSGVVHSAFELEGQDYDGEARESLEVRVAAFW